MSRKDETCDPEEQICRTPAHTFEAPCACCSGTGWARTGAAAAAFHGGGHGSGHGGHGRGHAGGARLAVCLACHGIGGCPLEGGGTARAAAGAATRRRRTHMHRLAPCHNLSQSRALAPPPAGYVRHTTTRFVPEDPTHLTLARTPPPEKARHPLFAPRKRQQAPAPAAEPAAAPVPEPQAAPAPAPTPAPKAAPAPRAPPRAAPRARGPLGGLPPLPQAQPAYQAVRVNWNS
jgi:hypothetical protein